MAQEASSIIPPKGLWTLKLKDIINGALVACMPQILAILDFWNSSDHWPSYSEWQPYLKMTIYTFIVYVLKNFSTNNVGQLFRADKQVVAVHADTLVELKQKADDNAQKPQ